MRPGTRRALAWQAAGLVLYLGGVLLTVVVAVGVYLSPPANSFANVSTPDLLVIAVGVGLVVAGRVVSATRGHSGGIGSGSLGLSGDQHPRQSKLEELGYRVPPESGGDGPTGYAYEDGEVLVVCETCGERNDDAFEYCRNCSAQLPG